MTIKLIVKGYADDAQRAAAYYGVYFTTVLRESEHIPETILIAPQHTRERVVKWFLDAPLNAPYPMGTLLWYRD